jgi:hypothetical protein
MPSRAPSLSTIRSEGGLLPTDLLARIAASRSDLPGTSSEHYGLQATARLSETITQSWNALKRRWASLREDINLLPKDRAGTSLTNEKWTLPLLRELGFGFLPTTPSREIGPQKFPITRFFGATPIHLVGCRLSLDQRAPGEQGAARSSPHGLLQEFLNRSGDHTWGILSNGLQFRILRDSKSLSRQSFLEFDLEAMFDGEVYSDFALLFMLAHATRFTRADGQAPASCLLDDWSKEAEVQGTRALTELKRGVEDALLSLGEGLSGHRANAELRRALSAGTLSLSEFHAQLLRVIYRFIFLFVTEDRLLDGQSLLHPPASDPASAQARSRYTEHYSTARLRRMAGTIKGSNHSDLWTQFQTVLLALSGESEGATARSALALPPLGGFLWSPASTSDLNTARLTNYDLLRVIRHLAFTVKGRTLRAVDYKNLGAEELGGVYESLLALTPQLGEGGAGFTFQEFSGNERKTSGSYYTPDSLVQELLNSALDPVVEARLEEARQLSSLRKKGEHGRSSTQKPPPSWAEPLLAAERPPEYTLSAGALAEEALLSLRVCDPAVGSGHFLVGAAHRLARHLARVRATMAGDAEPSPLLYQKCLRDVIGRCLYGVDINPMAAELCRVSLWLEALEPGKPLSFLDHHIRVGNSLLGATPDLIAGGLPDEAFKPIGDDDRKVCNELKRANKSQRESRDLFPVLALESAAADARLAVASAAITLLPDDRPDLVREKEAAYIALRQSTEYQRKVRLYDTWCAAFVIRKEDPRRKSTELSDARPPAGITMTEIEAVAGGHAIHPHLSEQVTTLAKQYQFFHWHLAFPEVFADGGFDCVLGNPPWERVKLQEKEWFAQRDPAVASASNASVRKTRIAELERSNPALFREFQEDVRRSAGESHLLRNSGRFPLCGRGDINVYTVFAEGMRTILSDHGRVGCVLPTGIATDDTTKHFFQDVFEKKSLVSLFDFENRQRLFPSVLSLLKFCLFTCGRGTTPTAELAEFVFFAHATADLYDPERRFTLSSKDIKLLNPNTRTCPIFRSKKDAELTKAIYRRVPVLIREAEGDQPEQNPWGIKFSTLFHMSNDSHLFRTRDDLESDGWHLEGNIFKKEAEEFLPLYEAKMIHHFDHRWATYDGDKTRDVTPSEKRDPHAVALPRYWVPSTQVTEALSRTGWNRRWLLGWRDICRSTDERTVIAGLLPRAAVNHKYPVIMLDRPSDLVSISVSLSSLAFDYTSRQKLSGTSLTYFYLKQFPAPQPGAFDAKFPSPEGAICITDWLISRVLELTYTAWDLQPFALDCGFEGPPFRWDDERRFLLRCELDAAFFHLYLPSDSDGNWALCASESADDRARLLASLPTPRSAVDAIMDSFPIVRKKDEAHYGGVYRTKLVILEIYDAMQTAIRTNLPFVSRLDPPPAHPSLCHPPLS